MSWNYRCMEMRDGTWSIVEAFYNKDMGIYAVSGEIAPHGDEPIEPAHSGLDYLKHDMELMMEAFKQPPLHEVSLVFAKPDWKDKAINEKGGEDGKKP